MGAPPLIRAISKDPVLSKVKLIAEPWDCGGYQVGSFPNWDIWAEWNGIYRDTVRRFVRGDPGLKAELATRIAGSADLYNTNKRCFGFAACKTMSWRCSHFIDVVKMILHSVFRQRRRRVRLCMGMRARLAAFYTAPSRSLPACRKASHSVNFVIAHDGFTLRDLVSYNDKHNEANGEDGKDGTNDNFSWNCGAEGETQNAGVNALRWKQMRNLQLILLVSRGTPMVLAGAQAALKHGAVLRRCLARLRLGVPEVARGLERGSVLWCMPLRDLEHTLQLSAVSVSQDVKVLQTLPHRCRFSLQTYAVMACRR